MIEAAINKWPIKGKIPFPKLMRGNRTGAIYLALSEQNSLYGPQIQTIVLVSGSGDSFNIGHKASYQSIWLDDFDGEITLRNKNV